MFQICTNITSKIINSFNISNLINGFYKETKFLNKMKYKMFHFSHRKDSLGVVWCGGHIFSEEREVLC